MNLISSSSFFSFLAFILTSTIIFNIHQNRKKSRLPPGPWKLPVIGNLHQLAGDQPHRRLRDLAAKHGPDVMHIQLGEIPHIVISSPESAKLVLKTHDLAFASRPTMLAVDVIGSGPNGIAFAPYGEHWRQVRKICVQELLTPKRVLSFRHIREEEVSNLVESLNSGANQVVDVSAVVVKMLSSVTSRAAFGKVSEISNDAFLMIMENMSDVLSGFRVSDLYPSMKLLPSLTGYRAKLEKMRKASDSILEQIIDEHRSRRSRVSKDGDGETEDLVDEMFLAGSDSSAASIEWIISDIINDQRVQRTVQEELRQVFKNTGTVEEARLGELKYLDIVISESLRLHPPGPLLVPRFNEEKVELSNGCEIPAKTKVLVNAWAICRDSRHWKEPEKFYPERFADCSTDFKGNYFEFIPFGAGRRICPGISFATVTLKLALANLFFHFNWRLPASLESTGLDMTEVFGLTLTRKHPLCLIPVPYKD
ncbi:Cytochrome P450 71D8 [Linum perenne]